MDPSNYRLNFVTAFDLKTFEKIVHGQTIDYLVQCDILCKY